MRKLVTLVKRPRKSVEKYFRIVVLRQILPIYNEDYDLCWSQVDYKDRAVLDLGADYGSTAYYFLKRGAKTVVAVEGDRALALKLEKNYWRDDRVVCLHKWIGDSFDYVPLILIACAYHCDLAKVDVEGAEKHLAGVPPEVLRDIREWLIESHTLETSVLLIQKFLSSGFKVYASNYDILGVDRILHCIRCPGAS